MVELTKEELAAVEISAALRNAFAKLPVQHVNDAQEMCAHIHAIQNMIMARPIHRELNK